MTQRGRIPLLVRSARLLEEFVGYSRFAWQLATGSRLKSEHAIAVQREQDIAPHFPANPRLRVLDLANGRLHPQYAILQSSGHCVFGIDLANKDERTAPDAAYRIARWLYWRRLHPTSRSNSDNRLICGDVGKLPFTADSFDLVTSIAAFEHFLDVPATVAELARVLRPGGIAWVGIHLFTSPSGGHNIGYTEIPLKHLPAGVEPWDHLRKRRLAFTVPLNEWRRQQYLDEFGHYFEILKHYATSPEGHAFLTPEIRAELANYTLEELTSRGYIIVARKLADC